MLEALSTAQLYGCYLQHHKPQSSLALQVQLGHDCVWQNVLWRDTVLARPGYVELGSSAAADGARPPVAQVVEYEAIDWDAVMEGTIIASSYFARKGVNRKAQLAKHAAKHCLKHPTSPLQWAVPTSFVLSTWDLFEADGWGSMQMDREARIEFLLADVSDALEAAPGLWMVKSSLSNKAEGLFIVDSIQELTDVLLGNPDIREWVVQKYVDNPLLVWKRKFHLRMYAVAVGALSVFLFHEGLVFLAAKPYAASHSHYDRLAHITNSCVARESANFNATAMIRLASELPYMWAKQSGTPLEVALQKAHQLYQDIRGVIAHAFDACRTDSASFSAHPNCFELYAVDLLVTDEWKPVLLEFNACPDMGLGSAETDPVIRQLADAVISVGLDMHPWCRHLAPAAGAVTVQSTAKQASLPSFGGFKRDYGAKICVATAPPPLSCGLATLADGVTLQHQPTRPYGPMDLIYSRPWQIASGKLQG